MFPFRCKINPVTIVVCGDSGAACQDSVCQPKTGTCAKVASKDGSACSDDDGCTVGDACKSGVCAPGGDNVCTCATSADCLKKEDGDACNGTLYCDVAAKPPVCKVNPATVVTCPKGGADACTTSACTPATGLCQPAAAPPTTACDDGDACTSGDHCLGGLCQAGTYLCACTKDSDCADKDDGNKCNGIAFCDKATGQCAPNPASVVVCPTVDDTGCAKTVCLPKEGTCTQVARADAVLSCTGDKGQDCAWQPKIVGQKGDEGPFKCDDGNACTTGDVCEGKACKSAAAICECTQNADCEKEDDGDLCNGIFYCDKSLKVPKCVFNPASKVFCSPLGNTACLTNSCDGKSGVCGLQPNKGGSPCEDGDVCTAGTTCDGLGGCKGNQPTDCDDGDECTVDSCKTPAGCMHVAKSCDDGNACTVDSCDTKTGKCDGDADAMKGKVCNGDNSGCTVNDTCTKDGVCATGNSVICTQAVKACQVARCLSQGPTSFTCVVLPASDGAACDDDDACSLASECTQGTCSGAGHAAFFHRRLQAGTYTKKPVPGLRSRITDLVTLADGSAVMAGIAWTGVKGDQTSTRYGWLLVTDANGQISSGNLAPPPYPDTTFEVTALSSNGGTVVSLVGDTAYKDDKRALFLYHVDVGLGTNWSKVIGDLTKDARAGGVAGQADGGATWVGAEVTKTGGAKPFIGRTTLIGNPMWRYLIPTTESAMPLSLKRVGTDGGTVGCGWTGTTGQRNGWLFRHDKAGKLLWQRRFVTANDGRLNDVAVTSSGTFAAAGANRVNGYPYAWAVMTNASGVLARQITSPVGSELNSLVTRGDDAVVFAGSFHDPSYANRAYLGVLDVQGNLEWVRNPPMEPGRRDVATAVGVLANGRLFFAGYSEAVGGGKEESWYVRADPWGRDSCASSGACGDKAYYDCSDGKSCNLDLCSAATGCFHAAPPGLLCKPGDACHLDGACSGATCNAGQATLLYAKTVAVPGVTSVAAIATLPDGGVAVVGRGADANNVSVRISDSGGVVGVATDSVTLPVGSAGLGAVAVAPIGGDIAVLGHVTSGGTYPHATLQRRDLEGKAM